MGFKVDFSNIKTVRVHKEQFDSIEKKANVLMLTCIEDGRVIAFNKREINGRTNVNSPIRTEKMQRTNNEWHRYN